MAKVTSFFCKVRRLFSSVCIQDRRVTSWMNSSAALAKIIGASALIILTSSSSFIIFLILANGSSGFLLAKSVCINVLEFNFRKTYLKKILIILFTDAMCSMSFVILGQKLLRRFIDSFEAPLLLKSIIS